MFDFVLLRLVFRMIHRPLVLALDARRPTAIRIERLFAHLMNPAVETLVGDIEHALEPA
jgi:hypothetical protein